MVQDGETGWLCGAGDAAGLARLLQQVIAQPEASWRLAEAGRRPGGGALRLRAPTC